MKKQALKLVTLLLFTSVAISSCSLDYRQRRAHRNDPNWQDPHSRDRDHHNDRHDDHHYDNYHRY
ncbi:hypothetical protein [Mucilaginibacter panaciglaebae]|uniref:hypothetical protein n=1 Tax=Mucilaginibacter panaciglaebae TaxID=502331 RepID=UPI0031EC507B